MPALGPSNKNTAISPSSAVYGGRYDTKYVTFEYHRYCMRDSRQTQVGEISLYQLVRYTTPGSC